MANKTHTAAIEPEGMSLGEILANAILKRRKAAMAEFIRDAAGAAADLSVSLQDRLNKLNTATENADEHLDIAIQNIQNFIRSVDFVQAARLKSRYAVAEAEQLSQLTRNS